MTTELQLYRYLPTKKFKSPVTSNKASNKVYELNFKLLVASCYL